jgi:hypothetical protein
MSDTARDCHTIDPAFLEGLDVLFTAGANKVTWEQPSVLRLCLPHPKVMSNT